MGERTIAEIIGVSRLPQASPTSRVFYEYPDGSRRIESDEHTVDDLLDWLDVNITTSWTADGRARFVGWGRFSMAAGFEHQHSAQTFLAALEAAVRAVDNAEVTT